jgi:AcrR family transcriptional regulator
MQADRPEPSPGDRRTARTRAALRHALLALMGERGWDAIGVQEICERADIGRSTFYTHFRNKDELLSGGFDDLRQGLLRANTAGPARATVTGGGMADMPFLPGLIEHAYENRKLFRTLIGRRSGHVVHQRFKQMLVSLVEEQLPPVPSGVPRAAAARWTAGALFELLSWWVESRSPATPKDLLEMARRLSTSHAPGVSSMESATAR